MTSLTSTSRPKNVLVIGDKGVGKTTLIDHLTTSGSPSGTAASTIRSTLTGFTAKLQKFDDIVHDGSVLYRFIDSPALTDAVKQSIQDVVHLVDCIVAVFDISKGSTLSSVIEAVKELVYSSKTLAQKIKVFFVGNKSDDPAVTSVTPATINTAKAAGIQPILVSLTQDEGLEELGYAMRDLLNNFRSEFLRQRKLTKRCCVPFCRSLSSVIKTAKHDPNP